MLRPAKIAQAILSLFIDDARFAGSIVVWIGVSACALPLLCHIEKLRAPLLFVGLTLIFFSGAFFRIRRGA